MKLSEEMLATCACTRVRTAARVVTRVYDEFLRSAGLKASQLAVLAAIDSADEVSIAALSKRLLVDRTTLSRNLKPLIADGLVALGEEGWRRSKFVRITKAGRLRLESALPLWQRAQQGVFDRFGKKRWQAVDAQLGDLIANF